MRDPKRVPIMDPTETLGPQALRSLGLRAYLEVQR